MKKAMTAVGGAAVAAVLAGSAMAFAAPAPDAAAAPQCGNTSWLKIQDRQLHGVVQSCEAGAEVLYTIGCGPSGVPFPPTTHTVTVSRYFATAQTGQVTTFRCSAAGSPAHAEDLVTVTSTNWEYA